MAKPPRTNDKLSPQAEARRAASLGLAFKNGWCVLPSRGGPPVTSELVRRLLDEADFEDAGLERHDDHRA
ncbi:MAG: hypothetical protein ABSG18_25750 [Steroidobacteraceae bacterium]